MVVERYTYERACQIEREMAARGMGPAVQGQKRRLAILRNCGLPRVHGPRPLHPGRPTFMGGIGGADVEPKNVYTWSEVAAILTYPTLDWPERERFCRYGSDRAHPLPIEERRAYWRSVLVALALGADPSSL